MPATFKPSSAPTGTPRRGPGAARVAGLVEQPPPPPGPGGRQAGSESREEAWREWMMVGVGLTALLAILATIMAVVALNEKDASVPATTARSAAASAQATNPAFAPAPTLADAKGMPYERFKPVDPTLPAVPAGAVKKFTVGVMQHVTQVDPKLAPVQAWTYTVNGIAYRGTAASPPIVVEQGDKVQITFVNGASKAMGVNMAHSIDFHAAHVAPNKYYVDIPPGGRETFGFTASTAGVFMYHCATQPVLTHTGSGMTGMMVVKPRNLPPVARELWVTQQEFYIGQAGGIASQAKLTAENPDVVAFNGYASQYKIDPIAVPFGKPIRMWVLDAGPNKWTAFHVIGTTFDTTDVEGVVGHGSQTISLAPSQGGWVQFTLAQQGNYPFVTHDFGDMAKGAAGMLHTTGAPSPKGLVPAPSGGSAGPVLPSMVKVAPMSMGATAGAASATAAGASSAGSSAGGAAAQSVSGAVNVTMGEMWIKTPQTSAKAGKVTFAVANTGQMPHKFAIMKTPVKLAGSMPDAKAALAQTDSIAPGQSATVSATLKPGGYELVCMEPGHYASGQHIPFTVR